MRTAVVLPAPFGPSTPSTVPRGTDRSMPRSACTSPNDLVRPSTRMAGTVLVSVTTSSCAGPPVDTAQRSRTYRQRGPDREPITPSRLVFGGYDDHGYGNSPPGRYGAVRSAGCAAAAARDRPGHPGRSGER